jgi:hypothetical protein
LGVKSWSLFPETGFSFKNPAPRTVDCPPFSSQTYFSAISSVRVRRCLSLDQELQLPAEESGWLPAQDFDLAKPMPLDGGDGLLIAGDGCDVAIGEPGRDVLIGGFAG